MSKYLLLILSISQIMSCSATSNYQNPNYHYTQEPTKPLIVFPLQSENITFYDENDFVDKFKLEESTQNTQTILVDTLSHFFKLAADNFRKKITLRILDRDSIQFDYTITIIDETPKGSHEYYTFGIPKKGTIDQIDSSIVLFVNDIALTNDTTSQYAGGCSSNALGHSNCYQAANLLGNKSNFSVQFKYLLYDYTTDEIVSYGTEKHDAEPGFYFGRISWLRLIEAGVKSLIQHSPLIKM